VHGIRGHGKRLRLPISLDGLTPVHSAVPAVYSYDELGNHDGQHDNALRHHGGADDTYTPAARGGPHAVSSITSTPGRHGDKIHPRLVTS
jgi:hypothetical protein